MEGGGLGRGVEPRGLGLRAQDRKCPTDWLSSVSALLAGPRASNVLEAKLEDLVFYLLRFSACTHLLSLGAHTY